MVRRQRGSSALKLKLPGVQVYSNDFWCSVSDCETEFEFELFTLVTIWRTLSWSHRINGLRAVWHPLGSTKDCARFCESELFLDANRKFDAFCITIFG